MIIIEKMAKGFGIPEENIIIDSEKDFKELKASYMKLRRKSRALSLKGVPHTIIVYCGGHGATKDEKQIYLLNTNEAKQSMF